MNFGKGVRKPLKASQNGSLAVFKALKQDFDTRGSTPPFKREKQAKASHSKRRKASNRTNASKRRPKLCIECFGTGYIPKKPSEGYVRNCKRCQEGYIYTGLKRPYLVP